jgi:hypothetical protein
MAFNFSGTQSCGHKKSTVKSVGRSWRRWESLASESAAYAHIKCDTCRLLAMIENLAEPTHVGLYKYSTKRAVEVLEFDEAAAAA